MKRVLFGILFLVLVLIVGFALIASREQRGVEFCPQTFQQRAFVYYKNAFGSYNMDREPAVSVCGPSISGHLKPLDPNAKVKRWDLVSGVGDGEKVDDAVVLMRYLTASNFESSWDLENWSIDNPGLAKELWPRVQDLAIQDMYFAIPELIGYALQNPGTAQFIEFADKAVLKSSVAQLRHLLSIQRNKDKDIQLVRLASWLENQQRTQSEVTDLELQAELVELLAKVKQDLSTVVDGVLSNEETIAGEAK